MHRSDSDEESPSLRASTALTSIQHATSWPPLFYGTDSQYVEPEPVTESQIVEEIDQLYAKLSATETRCQTIVKNQSTAEARQRPITNLQWQALSSLHRTLLYDYHDILLASQHSSAPLMIKNMPVTRGLIDRHWSIGVYAYIELLRDHPTRPVQFMSDHIYLSFHLIAALYETIPRYRSSWAQRLGDLSRFGIWLAGPDLDMELLWAAVGRHWYSKVALTTPGEGQTYQYLAIVSRQDLLRQIFYFTKSLTCTKPFMSSRTMLTHSLQAVNKSLKLQVEQGKRDIPTDVVFVNLHAGIIAGTNGSMIGTEFTAYAQLMQKDVQRNRYDWREVGAYIAMINISSWFQYGLESNPFCRLFLGKAASLTTKDFMGLMNPSEGGWLYCATSVTLSSVYMALCACSQGAPSSGILPHLHIFLLFMEALLVKSSPVCSLDHLIGLAPWADLATCLTSMTRLTVEMSRTERLLEGRATIDATFAPHFLPEIWLIQGCLWTRPIAGGLKNVPDEDLPVLGSDAYEYTRRAAMVATGQRISALCMHQAVPFLQYDEATESFSTRHTPNRKPETELETTNMALAVAVPASVRQDSDILRKEVIRDVQVADTDHPVLMDTR